MNLVPLFSRIQLGLVFFLIFFSINLNAQNIDCNNLIILSCGDFFGSQQLTTLYEDNKFNYSNNYSTCFNSNASFNESDLIFRFEKFDYSDTYITLFNYGNVDLDLILFDDCTSIPSLMNCVDASTRSYGEPINGVNIDFIHLIDPGTYFFVVDGYTIGHKGDFYINIGCDDLQYSDCDNVPVVECNVPSDGTTCPANGNIWWTTEINNYDCLLGHSKQASLTGREEVYSFIAPESGEYTFNLSNFSQDLDMFLIDDACAGGNGGGGGGGTIINPNLSSRYNCLDFSANFGTQVEEITVNLSKDEKIYIVIDGFLDACSDFTLIVNGCTIQDEICDFCCDNLNAIYSDCVGFENYSFGNLLPQGSKKFKLFNPNTSNNSQSGLVVGGGKAKTGNWCLELDATTDIDYKINRQINDIARLEWSMNFPKDKYGAVGLQIGDQSYYPIFVHFEKGLAKVYQKNANNTSTLLTQFNYTEQKWDQYALIIRSDGRMGNQKGEIELWKDSTFIYKLENIKINSLVDFNMFYHPDNQSKSNFYIDNLCYQEQKKATIFPQYFDWVCVDTEGNNMSFANPHYAYDAGYTNCEIISCETCDEGDFENFNLGNISTQSLTDPWILWPNGGDGIISGEKAYNRFQSLKISYSNPKSDLVYKLGNKTIADGNWDGNDVYRYSWKMYVPLGNAAYYNMQHSESLQHWAYEVYFDQNGAGSIRYGDPNSQKAAFNYPNDSWFSVTQIIRLQQDQAELWIDGKFVHKWKFSTGYKSNAQVSNLNQIGAFNFSHGGYLNAYYFIDNFLCNGNGERCFGIMDCDFFPDIVCVNGNLYEGSNSNCGGLEAFCAGYSEEEWTVGKCVVKPGDVVEENIDPYLSTPVSNNIKEIPVVIIRYLPTIDGTNIDISKATDYGNLGEITIDKLKSNIDDYDKRVKFSLEEGSKFRGYKNTNENPYLGYKVIKYLTVYRQIGISNFKIGSEGGKDIFAPDYKQEFDTLGLTNFIKDNNVKEVWIWYGEAARPNWPSYDVNIHGNIQKYVSIVESNMSSPSTGDISNSHRYPDDLPVFNHTYVVYCQNFRRTQAEAVHNHGHQLESIYNYVAHRQDGNPSMFVQKYCGYGDNNYTIPPIGRAGDTHHPPNTKVDYDYLNSTLVSSDIEDWKPSGGTKKPVNVNTWGNLIYNWPGLPDFNQRVESQWYLYWMQNMPGNNNNIAENTYKMTNWWQFTSDWDYCYNNNIGLYELINSPTSLVFDIDDNVCGPVGQIVTIPVKVKGFSKVSSFQFTISLADNSKGEIIGIEKGNIAGDLNFGIISTATATLIWDNASPVDLPDNTVVINVKVRIKTSFSGVSDISIIGNPTDILAEQNSQSVKPTVIKGSYCSSASTYKICGKITREDNVAVPNVQVTLSGGKNASTTTSTSGDYCFDNLDANLSYTIKPSKNTNHVNGVNGGDVTAIRRHILAVEKLNSPFKIIAADAFKSNVVNGGDVTEIRKLILASISQFSTTESWAFVPKSHVFSNPANPFVATIPESITISSLNSNLTDQHFIGIKKGDVTLNNNPSNIVPVSENRNSTDINLIVGSANVIVNQSFDIDITVKQFNEITSGQFSVNWNTNISEFISLINLNSTLGLTNDNFNLTLTSTGKLGFLWDDTTPVTLPDNTKLFTLSFKSKSNGSASINITDDPVAKYFENKDKLQLNIVVTNGTIKVPTVEVEYDDKIKIFPNPTNEYINFESENVIRNLLVLNSTGKTILNYENLNSTKGILDLSGLSSGIYILRLRTVDGEVNKKISLIK